MRELAEIREDIDRIDQKIRELIMERLNCSTEVVASKIRDKNYVIYRADREESMLENLGADVPIDRRAEYLSVVRKVTETSRMYQYSILYEKVPELFEKLIEGLKIPEKIKSVKLVLTRPNIPNAMSSILSMIGDYGFNMDQMKLLEYAKDNRAVTFELVILGDIHDVHFQKLMLQLSMESASFHIQEFIEE